MAVDVGPRRLALYDLATLRRRDLLTFAHTIALTRFSQDGRRLFVLTADQSAYVIDVEATGGKKPGSN